MNLKFRVFRILSNGIYFAKDEEEKEEMQVCNILLHLLFFLTAIFCIVELYYGLYSQVILNFIIFVPAIISPYLLSKGLYNFTRILCIQSIITYVFLSNVCYHESKSLLYLYLVIIMNMPIVFRIKDLKYIIFFITESLFLFFVHVIFHDNLQKFSSISTKDAEIHKSIATIVLLVFLSAFLFFHVLIVQYRESKLKRNKANLIGIQRKLKSQNEDLQQFGLAVTHSLKTPLILTNGFLNRIRNNLMQDTSSDMNDHYFKIVKESNSLIEKYSEDLSAYNSVVNIRNQSLTFDIFKAIDDQVKMLTVRFEKAEIINEVESLTINTNLLLFEIIVQTLIENAIIYNDSEVPTLLIYSAKENSKVSIFFNDNGIGINKEFRDNIFLPFVRVNKKINVKGSGLGLTSAKTACDKIGAKISLLESSQNGSVFKLDLEYL